MSIYEAAGEASQYGMPWTYMCFRPAGHYGKCRDIGGVTWGEAS